jgi:hypothetical protein
MPIIRFGGFIQSKISKFPCDLPNKYFYAILAVFDFVLRGDFIRQIFGYQLSEIMPVFIV